MKDREEINNIDQEILDEMLSYFLPEARENLDHLAMCLIQMENNPKDSVAVETAFRIFHTLNGNAGFAGLKEIQKLGRAFEELIGEVKKGKVKLKSHGFDVLHKGLDVFNLLLDQAETGVPVITDFSGLLKKIDNITSDMEADDDYATPVVHDLYPQDQQELLSIYRDGYNQLGTLKHLIFESVSLNEPEALAVLISKQIHERLAPERNGIWLIEKKDTLVEIARNGEFVAQEKRRRLNFNSYETLEKVLVEQMTMWLTDPGLIHELFPEFQSPVLFPIKSKETALGILILDPEERTEVELYQFISQFAAIIMRISKLHKKVEEQREELDELTGILFRQNTQLSSLYHVEIALINESDPVRLCQIVVNAVVEDLGAKRAAAFLCETESGELVSTAECGGLNTIVGNRYKYDQIGPLAKCVKTGRIVTETDYGEAVEIGEHCLNGWIALCLKGSEVIHGAIIVEADDEDTADSISILTNYLGMILDNLALQEKVRKNLS